jgi:hypothetical protein
MEAIEGETYVEIPDAGLSAVTDGEGVIHSVQLHAAGHEHYAAFAEGLPGGLVFSMGRAEARARLGAPSTSGEAEDIPMFGRSNAWDRWQTSEGWHLHVQYGTDGASIELVSLVTRVPGGDSG